MKNLLSLMVLFHFLVQSPIGSSLVLANKVDGCGPSQEMSDSCLANIRIEAVIVQDGVRFRSSLGRRSTDIRFLNEGESVLVVAAQGYFFKATYKDNTGYIYYRDLRLNDDLKRIINASIVAYEQDKEQQSKQQQAIADELNAKIETIRSKYESKPVWINVIDANIKQAPRANSETSFQLRRGMIVFVHDQQREWTSIKIPTRVANATGWRSIDEFERSYFNGWIRTSLISTSPVPGISDEEYRREIFLRANQDISSEFRKAIRAGTVLIGMTKSMVTASWGSPEDINRTATAYGIHEQWLYPGRDKTIYVYFDNGVLTAWQD
jgi:hypothetical protein